MRFRYDSGLSAPALSAVVCNYNHARYIRRALEAILRQSVSPCELLVLDDASTDDSLAVIESIMATSPIIRLVRNESRIGVVANTNRAMSLVSGEYVYYGGADDYVLPGFFETALRHLSERPEAGLFTAGGIMVDEIGATVSRVRLARAGAGWLGPAEMATELGKRADGIVFGSSTIYKTSAMIEVGGLDVNLGALCDTLLDHAVAAKHGLCYDNSSPQSAWRRTRVNFSTARRSPREVAERQKYAAQWVKHPPNAVAFPVAYVRFFELEAAYADRCAALAEFEAAGDRLFEELSSALGNPGVLTRAGRALAKLWLTPLSWSISIVFAWRRLSRHLMVSALSRWFNRLES